MLSRRAAMAATRCAASTSRCAVVPIRARRALTVTAFKQEEQKQQQQTQVGA